MVYVVVGYCYSGKPQLWLGKGASEPACWRQAGLGAPFLLGWPTGKHVLQSEETNASILISITHDARHSKWWLTPTALRVLGMSRGNTMAPLSMPLSCLHSVHM